MAADGVAVRAARPDDTAASGLVFDAARPAYRGAAGSDERARATLEHLWSIPGHSASFEHALVAELDGKLVGVLIAFPARERYRLHFALLRRSLRHVPLRRWPLLALALPRLSAATPHPPRDSYYVATIAVAQQGRRRGIGSTLARHAELAAAARGFPLIVAHTGSRHRPARRALERYGAQATKDRSWGYALYAKTVDEPPDGPTEESSQ
jgi:GNAT superfamily N-acetyltransferase